MDRYSDNQPNLTDSSKKEQIIMTAFEEADIEAGKNFPEPAVFGIKLNETLVKRINDCETPDDYEELEGQLKNEIIDFTGKIFATDEPWLGSNEPGVDRFVLPALEYLEDSDGFVRSEQFQDAVVSYASSMAPYSARKARDAIGLTPASLDQKFIQKAYTTKADLESDKWSSTYNLLYPESIQHGVMVVSAISDMYPDDETLHQASQELAKRYIEDVVESYVGDNLKDMVPDWDEIAILGFDTYEMQMRKIRGETEDVIEFANYSEAEDFLDEKVREFIASYLAENGNRLADECISKNQLLKNTSDRTGIDLGSLFLSSIMGNLPDYFDDNNSDDHLALLHSLYNLVNEEYVRACEKARDEEEKRLGEIAADYKPELDRSGWDHDGQGW
jgi:hypothetical protein